MYQPTLGRFLSRDPLSENGVDVLTDTGFYADRLATMSANPWSYGGKWENPYVYTRNSPGMFVDPSGLQPESEGYFAFCKSVCDTAAKDPALGGGGGGILCKGGIKCVCLFKVPLGGGVNLTPGECKTLDACNKKHERQHLVDVDCPKEPGVTRPPFRPGIDPVKRECQLRKEQNDCIQKAIVALGAANTGGCNDNCINIANALTTLQNKWISANC